MKALRTGLAGTLLVLTVALGLVVQSSEPAAALQPPPIPKTGLTGVTVGEGGAVLVGETTNPVGWAIGLGTLAWWGYSNKDSIMDFLHGNAPHTLQDWAIFNCEKAGGTHAACVAQIGGSGGPWSDVHTSTSMGPVSGNSVTLTVSALQCPNGCVNFGTSVYVGTGGSPNSTEYTNSEWAQCKSAAGVITARRPPGTTFDVGRTSSGGSMTVSKTIQMCNPGESLKAFLIVGNRLSGQSYQMTYQSSAKYPAGDVQFAAAKVTAHCKNAKTGATTDIVVESDLAGGTVGLPSCKARLGADWFGTGITIAPEKPQIGGEDIPTDDPANDPIPDFPPFGWDELVPDEGDADWQPCIADPFGCDMGLWIDNDPCEVGMPLCEDWKKVEDDNPDRVKCKYGTRVVAIKYCLPLLNFYKPDTQTHTGTGTGTTTGTGTGDATGTDSNIDTETKPPLDPADAPDQAACFPHGWGAFNPFAWVYKPVKCVLVWAFEPSVSLSTRMNRMKDQLDNRAPFSWMASLAGLPATVAGDGCPDWQIHVKSVDKEILCGTPFGNSMHAARPVFAALMIGAAVYPLLRSVMYAAFPLVKPTPT